jgi:heme oxygenase-like protein
MPTVGGSILSVDGLSSHLDTVNEVSSWLTMSADDVDRMKAGDRDQIIAAVRRLNEDAFAGDEAAQYRQQILLSRIYQLIMRIPDGPTPEGSVILHEITRMLENATIEAESRHLPAELLDEAPVEGTAYLSWLKRVARDHRVFKHPYYRDFINKHSDRDDMRTYIIQESLVDGRFDDFLAMMQVGTSGAVKMEIAGNYWDEMGNGKPDEVHTYLFGKIYEVLDIDPNDLELTITASDLVAGNLAVLLCRYRQYYPEAVGYLGMIEWLAPERFQNVVRAWERLGLPEVGITYHRLHVTIDSRHAAGWFHNVVVPDANSSAFMRRGIARGALWRLNSSARVLDERLSRIARTETTDVVAS